MTEGSKVAVRTMDAPLVKAASVVKGKVFALTPKATQVVMILQTHTNTQSDITHKGREVDTGKEVVAVVQVAVTAIECWDGRWSYQKKQKSQNATLKKDPKQGISLVLRIRFKNLILKFFGGKKKI